MENWREVCERENGPLCDEEIHCSTCSCPGLLQDERDRLARALLAAYEEIACLNNWGVVHTLWHQSADPEGGGSVRG